MRLHTYRKPQSLREQFEAGYDSDDLEEKEPVNYRKEAKAAFGRIRVHLTLTKNDAVQRPVAFCIAMMSCIVVVVAVSLMVSALDNLPMVFLRLAESDMAEVDVHVKAGTDASDAVSLNYSRIEELFPVGDQSYHSPAFEFHPLWVWKMENCNPDRHYWEPTGPDADLYPDRIYDVSEVWLSPEGEVCHGGGVGTNFGCIRRYCNVTPRELRGWAFDTLKDSRAGIGRTWPFGPMLPGDVVIDNRAANALQVMPGDRLMIEIPLAPVMLEAYIQMNVTSPFKPYYTHYPSAIGSVRVAAVVEETFGKLSSGDTNWMMMEYNHIMRMFEHYLHPAIPPERRKQFGQMNPKEFAPRVRFNMPPKKRVDAYNSQEFSDILNKLSRFATPIVERLGFNQIKIDLMILSFMFDARFFSLFLGLILSLIIAILSVLAVVLIYSLMSVGIQTKTFEFAVLRMVGMQRRDLAFLIVIQALCFAIPAWAIGLALGQAAFVAISQVLEAKLSVELDPKLTPDAIGIATALGFTLPVIAGIFPMLEVMQHQLTSSLDGSRSKVKAVTFTVRRSTNSTVQWPLVILGIAMTIFGFCIYYLFPIALLNFDIQLMFYIFFGILMAMLFGLLLLALNLERPLEIFLTYLFFFWESAAVRSLILKNLIAHRLRNRKTTMMYSLSLGFIIFITVAFNIQVKTVEFETLRALGASARIANRHNFKEQLAVERSIAQLSGPGAFVKDFAYCVWVVHETGGPIDGEMERLSLETIGRYTGFLQNVRSASPNFFELIDQTFLRMPKEPGAYVLGRMEQLYTAGHSHMMYIGASYEPLAGFKPGVSKMVLLTDTQINRTTGDRLRYRRQKQAMALIEKAPVMAFSKFPRITSQDLVLSIPSLIQASNGKIRSVEELPFNEVIPTFILDDKITIDVFSIWFEHYMSQEGYGGLMSVADRYNDADGLKTAASILNTFFLFTAVIAMVICFFSLMSSMRANIFEQKKEIGILLSLGMRRFALARLYVWEAFILVLAAALMGICVGTMVAFTMNLQRALFVELPIPFEFPTAITVMVIIMSMVLGFLASIGPMVSLLSERAVSSIIRSM